MSTECHICFMKILYNYPQNNAKLDTCSLCLDAKKDKKSQYFDPDDYDCQ